MKFYKKIDKFWLFKRNKYKGTELIFIACFSMYIIASFFEYTLFFYDGFEASASFGLLMKTIRYFVYLLIFVKIIHDRYLYNEFIFLIGFFLMIILINYYVIRDKSFVFLLFLLLLSRNIKGRIVIGTHFVVTSSLLIITVLCSQMGIIQDIVNDSVRNRHYLGFFWTTTGPILFLFLSLEYYYLKKGKIGIISFLIINIVALFFYSMTDTRFTYLVTVLSSVTFLLLSYFPKLNVIIAKGYYAFLSLPFLTSLFAFLIHIKYNPLNDKWIKIDNLLSGRLKLGSSAIKDYGIHLFGTKIEWVGFQLDGTLKGTYNYVDSSYLQIALSFGLILLMVVLLIYYYLLKSAYKDNSYFLVCIVSIILVFSVTEPRLVNLVFNPFVLLVPSIKHCSRYYISESGFFRKIV